MKNRRHSIFRVTHFVSILTFTLSMFTGLISRAQDNRPVISLGVPEYFLTQFKDTIAPRLAQDLPDLRINLVTVSATNRPPDASSMEAYYKQIETEVSAADVLLVTPLDVTPEATRAGYFLDLKPLIDTDSSLDTSDFLPAAWKSFQWDGSTWALPSFFSTRFLVYDPAAFDQAGLTYPSAAWTLDELATAARQLTVKGADGTVPGLFIDPMTLTALFRAVLDEPFYDSTAQPIMPRFARPDLAALLQTWADLVAEGSATMQPEAGMYAKIPLRIGSASDLEDRGNVSGGDARTLVGSLLPHNASLLDVIGFAISKGTTQPDQSYQVIKALTALPEMRTLFGGGMAARSSVQAMTAEGEYQLKITPEERAFVESTAQIGLNPADLLFGNYLPAAINRVAAGEDALTALQAVEADANRIMQEADQKRDSVVVVVATPVPDVAAEGKVALKFGVFTGESSFSASAEWQKAIDEFVATDPQVGSIKLEFVAPVTADWGKKVQAFPDTTDCFFPAFAGVDTFADKVLSLDALMDADPDFSREDVLNGVLRDLERDEHVMGFPLSLSPAMLRYNIAQFEAAGIALPTDGWTVDEFTNALNTLKAQNPAQPVLYPYYDSGRYLLLLMAAYGALPVDWRTDPVTINYTDPKVVEVIRQVLDLAKSDTIRYSKTASFIFSIDPIPAPLVIEDFSSSSAGSDKKTGLTTFPGGTEFLPIAYSLDAAFVSASTAAPEACYRWLKALAHHPKLFAGVPALRSVINDPSTEALYGADTIATFQRFAELLSAPNAIIVHERSDKLGIAVMWLLRAFDNYVLKDADLEQELADAERFTKEYMACVTEMGQPVDKSVFGAIYVEDKCVNKIDPTFMDIFAPPPR
ncbi:MAG: extracellular solute-binding protein [Anaerolineae bacterium]|nr:extracellular solute-binding protein [Anaerolineae bacterium]